MKLQTWKQRTTGHHPYAPQYGLNLKTCSKLTVISSNWWNEILHRTIAEGVVETKRSLFSWMARIKCSNSDIFLRLQGGSRTHFSGILISLIACSQCMRATQGGNKTLGRMQECSLGKAADGGWEMYCSYPSPQHPGCKVEVNHCINPLKWRDEGPWLVGGTDPGSPRDWGHAWAAMKSMKVSYISKRLSLCH